MYADQLRKFAAKQAYKLFFTREISRSRNDDNHELTVHADTADDMAQDTDMTILVVDRDLEPFYNFTNDTNNLIIPFCLYMTAFRRDDVMCITGITANDDMAFFHAHRELHLIAVIPRGDSPYSWCNEKVLQFTDACRCVDDLLTFHA